MIKQITLVLSLSAFGISLFAQQWVQKEPLPVLGKNHAAAFSINGIGYIALGSNVTDQRDVHSYDPATDAWTELNDFPGAARGFAVGLSAANKGWVGFGLGENAFGIVYHNDLWQYTPETDTWKAKTSCPCAGRLHPSMVEVAGKIYIGAGNNQDGNLNDFWAYNIATDSWEQKASMPTHPRHHPFYFGIGDHVYVGFGHGGLNVEGFTIYKDFYKYTPSTDTWERLADFPDQGRVAGTQFSYNGKGYVLSGQDKYHVNLQEGEFWEYEPSTDTWTQLPSMPGSGRWAPTSFLIDSTVYAGTGTSNFGEESDLWAYTLPPVSSTSDLTEPHVLSITPNPAHSLLQIPQEWELNDNARVEIYAANGQRFEVKRPGNNRIDIGHLPSGMYFLKIQTNETVAIGRFLKVE